MTTSYEPRLAEVLDELVHPGDVPLVRVLGVVEAPLAELGEGGEAPAIMPRADLGGALVVALEDACQLGAGQRGIDARMVLTERFSVSRFWPEAAALGCTAFYYIGEIMRLLLQATTLRSRLEAVG